MNIKATILALLLAIPAYAHGDDWPLSCVSPELFISPLDLTSVGPPGGPAFTPSTFSFTMKSSCGKVSYAVDGIPNWLSLSQPTQGTVNTTGTVFTFTVTSYANSYPVGAYPSTMRIYNNSWTLTPLPHDMALAVTLYVIQP